MARKKKIIIPPINVIAKFIGVPSLMDWKGNCYGIASKIVKDEVIIDDCRAVYGHYLGPVSRDSFFKERIGMPFIPHGWIELSNSDVVDPTRWVFEAVAPYIALIAKGETDEYDEAGDSWRLSNEKTAPLYNENETCYPITLEDAACRQYLTHLLQDKRGKNIKDISFNQMFWLSNLSLQTLGLFTKEIYEWIEEMDCSAFIPMDNSIKIFGIKQEV